MMRIAKGRRPNTLRKHVKTWQLKSVSGWNPHLGDAGLLHLRSSQST